MIANAKRYDRLASPWRYVPPPPAPPPIPPAPPGWYQIAFAVYVEGEDDYAKKYGARNRDYLERTSWEGLADCERKEIIAEYDRREAEKKEAATDSDVAGEAAA